MRADRAIAALRELAAPHARVIRDGRELQVPAAEVVPGDHVMLRAGDIVPADGTLCCAEPPEPDTLDRPPWPSTERILADGLWQQILRLGAIIGAVTLGAAIWADRAGYPVQTTAFLTLGLLQLGSAFALRVRLLERRAGNPFLLVAVAAAIALRLRAVYAPPAQDLLGTHPLTGMGLAVPLAASLCGYLTVRIEDVLVIRLVSDSARSAKSPRSPSASAAWAPLA